MISHDETNNKRSWFRELISIILETLPLSGPGPPHWINFVETAIQLILIESLHNFSNFIDYRAKLIHNLKKKENATK